MPFQPSHTPGTDAGNVPNLRFSFGDAYRRVEEGGWSREVTVRELPVSTALAGVNMPLDEGGVRELHWHRQAEWAYMLQGRARITAVDQAGRSFADDVDPEGLWYFPAGIPHSIQGLERGCEFLLVFDDGAFSESSTFSITDWLAHTPHKAVRHNLGFPEEAVDALPEGERFIFPARLPGSLVRDRVPGPMGTVPESFSFDLREVTPVRSRGGDVRIADSSNFPMSATVAAALVEVPPGGMRELHWHPNADEWQYYLAGSARMTVFAAEGRGRTFEYEPEDVGYVPVSMGHHVENRGSDTLRFLEVFRADRFVDISLARWMALTPPELVAQHLNVDPVLIDRLGPGRSPIR